MRDIFERFQDVFELGVDFFGIFYLRNSESAGGGLDEDGAVVQESGAKAGDVNRGGFDFGETEIDDGFFEKGVLGDLADALIGDDVDGKIPEKVERAENEQGDKKAGEENPENGGVIWPDKKGNEAEEKGSTGEENAALQGQRMAAEDEFNFFVGALAVKSQS